MLLSARGTYVSSRPPVPTAPLWYEGHVREPLLVHPCPRARVPEAAPAHSPFSAQQDIPRCYLGVLSVGRKHSRYRACSPHLAWVASHHSVRGQGETGQPGRTACGESGYFQPCLPREPLGPRCPCVWVSTTHGSFQREGLSTSIAPDVPPALCFLIGCFYIFPSATTVGDNI